MKLQQTLTVETKPSFMEFSDRLCSTTLQRNCLRAKGSDLWITTTQVPLVNDAIAKEILREFAPNFTHFSNAPCTKNWSGVKTACWREGKALMEL